MTHISFYGKGIPIHNEDKEVTHIQGKGIKFF